MEYIITIINSIPEKQEQCNNRPEGTQTTWLPSVGNQTQYPLRDEVDITNIRIGFTQHALKNNKV